MTKMIQIKRRMKTALTEPVHRGDWAMFSEPWSDSRQENTTSVQDRTAIPCRLCRARWAQLAYRCVAGVGHAWRVHVTLGAFNISPVSIGFLARYFLDFIITAARPAYADTEGCFVYVAARRHICFCFMAKSAFWRGFSALAPYTGVGPI